MPEFLSTVSSTVSSIASSIAMPEFWIALWPKWKASVLTCAAILLFRILYRSFIIYFTEHLKNTYLNRNYHNYIDKFFKAFNHPIQTYLWIFALYMFIVLSPVDPFAHHPAFDKILRSSLIVCIIWGVYNLCDAGHGLIIHILERTGLNIDKTIAGLVSAMAHFLCIMLGIAMVAREWDYDITAFVASLGIGAMAIAFAAKDSLANIFGSIIIILERPFVIGDWVSANNVEGYVEKISFRSTCIRTLYQELVYVPNSLLSNTPIINYTKRQKFRIQYVLGVTYSTTRGQLQTVCQQIRHLCEQLDSIHSDGVDVNFYEFGDSSLNIRIVCYAKAPNISSYLKIREKFNYGVMQILEENGVSCAFPSQSVYFETPLPKDNAVSFPVEPQPVPNDLRNAKGVRIEKIKND